MKFWVGHCVEKYDCSAPLITFLAASFPILFQNVRHKGTHSFLTMSFFKSLWTLEHRMEQDPWFAVKVLVELCAGALVVFFASHTLHNLYFHPLSRFPGPRLWAATKLTYYYYFFKGTLDWKIVQLHRDYGEVLRTAPNELSFTNSSVWREIYGGTASKDPNHKSLEKSRLAYASIIPMDSKKPYSLIYAPDDIHAHLRGHLGRAFSDKALRSQEGIVQHYVDLMITRLKEVTASSSSPSPATSDMVKWYIYTTFDIIGDLALGESFGCLEHDRAHSWVSVIFDSLKFTPLQRIGNEYASTFGRVIKALTPKSAHDARDRHLQYSADRVKARIARGKDLQRKDFFSFILDIDDEERRKLEDETNIDTNAYIILLAGSETTATLLSGVTYLLLRSPESYARAKREVRSAFKHEADMNFGTTTSRLPYVRACLSEALRLYPPAPSFFHRQTSKVQPETKISGHVVPPGVGASVHALAAMRHPDNFWKPDDFRPERWLVKSTPAPAATEGEAMAPDSSASTEGEREEEHIQGKMAGEYASLQEDLEAFRQYDNKAAFQPFSYGPRNCIGKSLALAEMRLILARVLWRFDMELAEEELEQSKRLGGWMERQKVFVLWDKGPLMCRVKEREGLAEQKGN